MLELSVGPFAFDVPIPSVLGANDPGGDSTLQAKWAPDSQDPVANVHRIRVSKLRDGERFAGLHLDHSQVRRLVCTHDLGKISFASLFSMEKHPNTVDGPVLAFARNYVVVG